MKRSKRRTTLLAEEARFEIICECGNRQPVSRAGSFSCKCGWAHGVILQEHESKRFRIVRRWSPASILRTAYAIQAIQNLYHESAPAEASEPPGAFEALEKALRYRIKGLEEAFVAMRKDRDRAVAGHVVIESGLPCSYSCVERRTA